VHEQAVAGIPSGRFTTAEEVAMLVVLLASPRTANVTGANYVIDGRTRQDAVTRCFTARAVTVP
jgi:NAD(P)-dependent dehydrogenase (short-subunit alcohol dehydrogenase family)